MTETWAACLTSPGAAAIATIAMRGPHAWDVARELFRLRDREASLPPLDPSLIGRFWLGHLGEGVTDEVVLSVRRVDTLPWLEIHGHGGSATVRLLLDTLSTRRVKICSWQELERVTVNPLHGEIAAELARAATTRTAAVLLDQYHGAFERALTEIRTAIHTQELGRALALLAELARWSALGRHLTTPWRVAVIGPPNVGKSSLVNALAGYQRSIVSQTPGTTRDVVTTQIAVDGWPIELVDTAGLRDQAGTLEGQGIERARSAAANADLRLWILDASTPPLWPDVAAGPVRCVINKVDLPAAWDLDRAPAAIRVSALSRAGLTELCSSLATWLVPESPEPGAAVPFSANWCARLEQASPLLKAGSIDELRRLLGDGHDAGACPS